MRIIYVLMVIAFVGCTSCSKTVIIGELEVMTEDLGTMTWDDAKESCAELGDGWRLPTKEELNFLYENKDEIGGLALNYYWSSSEFDNFFAWNQDLFSGNQSLSRNNLTYYVRAVRDLRD